MNEIMAMATEFFLAHTVAICVVLGVLLILSSSLFLKTLNKRSKAKKSIEAQKAKPELDPLEKMYLDSLNN